MRAIAKIFCLTLLPLVLAQSAQAAAGRQVGAASVTAKPGWGRSTAKRERPESVRVREASLSSERLKPRLGKPGWQRSR